MENIFKGIFGNKAQKEPKDIRIPETLKDRAEAEKWADKQPGSKPYVIRMISLDKHMNSAGPGYFVDIAQMKRDAEVIEVTDAERAKINERITELETKIKEG